MSGGESSDSSETVEASVRTGDRSAARPRGATRSQTNTDVKAGETQRKTQHHYHDRSNVTLNQVSAIPEKRSAAFPSFPTKLFEMLDLVERDGFSHIISWQPHGRCFVVHSPTQLEALLHRYLPGISKARSFQRQASRHDTALS
jgi:HSF-type DNA-binding